MTRTMAPIVSKSSILPRMPVIRKTQPDIIMPIPPVWCVVRGNYKGKGREISRRRATPNASAPASQPATLLIRPAQAEQVVSQVVQHHLLSNGAIRISRAPRQ